MAASVVLLVVIIAIGVGLTTWIPGRLRLEERIAIGAAVGALVVSIVSLAAFVVVGMGWPTLAIGLGLPGVGAVAGIHRSRGVMRADARYAWHRLRLPARHSTSLRPFALITVASAVVTTRVLSLAYQTTPEGIRAGNLAVWGDWSAHLAYAGSFAYGDNRGFDQPIATGHDFRYHFLADFFGSLFTVPGASLTQALVLSEWLLAVAFVPLLWCTVMRITRSRSTAVMTTLLFTLGGGLGVWYFADDIGRGGWSITTSLPRTYARIPDQHIWVDNAISASLYAQRSTLMGLTVGLSALIIVLVARPTRSRAGFTAAGVIVGMLGISHGHTLLTALALATMALLADRDRIWLWFIMPAAAIGLPLTYLILPETSSIRWLAGWMASAADQPWPWFWIRNVGLVLPVFAALTLLGGPLPRVRRLTAPLWLWFIVPNLIAFHPWDGNNTKYFMYWQLGASLAIASWACRTWGRSWRRTPSTRTAMQFGLAAAFALTVSAGALDTVRAMQRSSAIAWVDSDDIAAAEWLRDNAAPDAVIVYGATNTSAVAALGGRRVVSGYPGWTYDLGLTDWPQRRDDSSTVLAGTDGVEAAIDRYDIDYVAIGPHERRLADASAEFWRARGTLVFESGDQRIYAVGP